jgi:hypothetical protein
LYAVDLGWGWHSQAFVSGITDKRMDFGDISFGFQIPTPLFSGSVTMAK